MTDSNSKSISSLSRNFILPKGTQVVLSVMKKTGESFKKPGSVGVVVKCPPHNELPYTVEFNDQTDVEASFDELRIRRQEIDNLLTDETTSFRDSIIYRCQVGSRAFGLSDDSSDDDYRGVFLPPSDKHWSLYSVPEQIENNDGQNDEVYWEIEKFLRLALKANPNILETLWTPLVLDITPVGRKLIDLRTCFLSQHLYKTYSGYVLSQFRRMKNAHEKSGKYKTKHAMHLLRLLHSGINALQTGEILVDVSDHRDELLRVKRGEFSFEEVREMSLRLDQQFRAAFDKTTLPDQPDFAAVDAFLIEARRSMVQ